MDADPSSQSWGAATVLYSSDSEPLVEATVKSKMDTDGDGDIYLNTHGSIVRLAPDGSAATTVISGLGTSTPDPHVTIGESHLYYTSGYPQTGIWQVPLDELGTEITDPRAEPAEKLPGSHLSWHVDWIDLEVGPDDVPYAIWSDSGAYNKVSRWPDGPGGEEEEVHTFSEIGGPKFLSFSDRFLSYGARSTLECGPLSPAPWTPTLWHPAMEDDLRLPPDCQADPYIEGDLQDVEVKSDDSMVFMANANRKLWAEDLSALEPLLDYIDLYLGEGAAGSSFASDPVQTFTGNLFHKATDLPRPRDDRGLSLERSWNSQDIFGEAGVFGRGWSSIADIALDDPGGANGVRLRLPDGGRPRFVESAGVWRARGIPAELVESGGEWDLVWHSGGSWHFDAAGVLVSMSTPNGETLVFDRAQSAPVILRVSNPATGWHVDFEDGNDDGLVEQVEDSRGRLVDYSYTGGVLTSVSNPYVGGAPDSTRESYVPASASSWLIGEFRNGEGELIVGSSFDALGRVVSQVTPSGETVDFVYSTEPDGSGEWTTTVTYGTGPDAEVIQYVHSASGEIVEVVDPDANSLDKSYVPEASPPGSDNGAFSGATTRRGAVYSVDYDPSGRIEQRVLADPDTGGPGASEYLRYESPTDDRPRTSVNAEGEKTSYHYAQAGDHIPSEVRRCDVGGDVDAVCPASGAVRTTTVQLMGSDRALVDWTEDADGVRTDFAYGPATGCATHQVCSVTQGAGSGDEVTVDFTYDAATGEVETVTTAAGTTTLDHDPWGRVVSAADALVDGTTHHPTTIGFDAAGRPTWVSDASNPDADGPTGTYQPSVAFEYWDEGLGQPVGELMDEVTLVQQSGPQITTTTRTTYDSSGRVAEVVEAFGTPDAASTELSYGPLSRVSTITDPVGVVTQLCYDPDGNVVARIEGLADTEPCDGGYGGLQAHTAEYDYWNRPTRMVDPTGRGAEYAYDLVGRPTRVTEVANDGQNEAAQVLAEHDYNEFGDLVQSIVAPPNVESFAWTDPVANGALVYERRYTPAGRLLGTISPNPNLPTWDEGDIPEGFEWQDTVGSRVVYDGAGRPAEFYPAIVDVADLEPAGEPFVAQTYDASGRPETVTSPEGRSTTYSYDSLGRVEDVAWTSGSDDTSVRSYAYDPLGRVTKTTVAHDDVGAPLASLSGSTYGYNAAGWLTTATDPNGAAASYIYDNRGNRTRSTADQGGPEALNQRWVYDQADRLTSEWWADGDAPSVKAREITYGYGAPGSGATAGRLTATSDASGRVETLGYDLAGRVTQRAHTDGTDSFDYTYGLDASGREVSLTDSRDAQNPLTQTWDVAGNLIAQGHPTGETHTWDYGAGGQVTHRDTDGDSDEMLYFLDGRLAHTWRDNGWLRLNIGSWDYDTDGLATNETYLELHWDDSDPPIAFDGRGWGHDDAGLETNYLQAIWDLGDGEWEHLLTSAPGDRDLDGRQVHESVDTAVWDGQAWDQTGSVERDYSYDPAGQLATLVDLDAEPDETTTYAYDPLGRRQSTTTPAGTRYDTYDGIGQLAGVDCDDNAGTNCSTTFTYDTAGRRATATTGDETTTYTYDPAGRLEGRAHLDDTTPVWDETRTINPLGQLTAIDYQDHTTQDTETTRVRWDPTRPVAQPTNWEHDDGTTTTDFGLLPGRHGEPVGDTGATGSGIHLLDPHGSQLDYFGATATQTVAGSATGFDEHGNPTDTPDQHTYLGYRNQVTTGDLIHLRNRDYDPTTGTFLTPDPLTQGPDSPQLTSGIGYEDGTTTVANPYHYVGNDPLNYQDPLGLCRAHDGVFLPEYEIYGETAPACLGHNDKSCQGESGDIYSPDEALVVVSLLGSCYAEGGIGGRGLGDCLADYASGNLAAGAGIVNPAIGATNFWRTVRDDWQSAIPIWGSVRAIDNSSDLCGRLIGGSNLASEMALFAVGGYYAGTGSPALGRGPGGLFGGNAIELSTRTSGGFVRTAGGPVRVFQTEAAGGAAAAERFFFRQTGQSRAGFESTFEAGGLRYTIRDSGHGARTVEVFDPVARTVEKIRFLG